MEDSTPDDDTLKRCPVCGETKLLDEFNKNKAARNGRQSRCRECAAAEYARKHPPKDRTLLPCLAENDSEECTASPSRKKGMCEKHYNRFRRYGDPHMVTPASVAASSAVGHCLVAACNEVGEFWVPHARKQGHPLCVSHYADAVEPSFVKGQCKIEGCDGKSTGAWGWCQRHYARWKQTGDPGPVGRLLAEKRSKLPLDIRRALEDMGATEIHTHIKTGEGYRVVRYQLDGRRRSVGMHRLVMEQIAGRPLYEFESVHHMNGIRDDNRPENLELWASHHGSGQRPEDIVRWVVANYPDLVWAELGAALNNELEVVHDASAFAGRA